MRDVDVFTRLLALPRPWLVESVTLSSEVEVIDVVLRHRSNARFCCPQCAAVLPLYDHVPLRRWRHLDHGSYRTWLHARLPPVGLLFFCVFYVVLPFGSSR